MSWLSKAENKNSGSTTLTTPPHVLPSYSEAAAKLDEVLRQQSELEAQLAQAIDRMNKACEGRAIPPWDHDRRTGPDRNLAGCEARTRRAPGASDSSAGRTA
jgi:hypothetical protein